MARSLRNVIKFVTRTALFASLVLSLMGARISPQTLPPGIYETSITEADIPPFFPPEAIPVLVGQWQIEFTEAGSYIVTKDGDVVIEGRYTSNPARVVLTDLDGPLACVGPGMATGVYAWSLDDDQLNLSVVRDGCAGRSLILTAHPLQRL